MSKINIVIALYYCVGEVYCIAIDSWGGGDLIISILQIRKLRCGEIESLPQRASNGPSQDLNHLAKLMPITIIPIPPSQPDSLSSTLRLKQRGSDSSSVIRKHTNPDSPFPGYSGQEIHAFPLLL